MVSLPNKLPHCDGVVFFLSCVYSHCEVSIAVALLHYSVAYAGSVKPVP